MRHVCLLDNKIGTREFNNWVKEDTSFWEEHLGITPTYDVIRTDYSDYPTELDWENDIMPTRAYMQSLNDLVVSKYGDFGTDFVLMIVHEDNFRSTGKLWEELKKHYGIEKERGIRGTNFSYKYGKQCFDYCMWDKDSTINTFGTMYHERFHSFDAIVKTEKGVNVEPLLDVISLDREVVHGQNPRFDYIRHKENTEVLGILKPYLTQAFKVRKDRHEQVVTGLKTIIQLAQKLIYLLRMQRKDGVPKTDY